MDETTEQIEELQRAYQDDPAIAQVLDAFSQYRNVMRTVTVDTIWDRVGRSEVNRSQVVASLKKLHSLGFGIYTKGAHGYASRFGFSRSQGPLRLAMLARGNVEDDDLPDDFSIEKENFNVGELEMQDTGMSHGLDLTAHKFRLREDMEIVFNLPGDLTFKEAKRLSLWLKSIPFDSEGDEY